MLNYSSPFPSSSREEESAEDALPDFGHPFHTVHLFSKLRDQLIELFPRSAGKREKLLRIVDLEVRLSEESQVALRVAIRLGGREKVGEFARASWRGRRRW